MSVEGIDLPDPDWIWIMFAALYVGVMPELPAKKRQRARRRISQMLDASAVQVINIRSGKQAKMVLIERLKAEAIWKAAQPELDRLVELTAN